MVAIDKLLVEQWDGNMRSTFHELEVYIHDPRRLGDEAKNTVFGSLTSPMGGWRHFRAYVDSLYGENMLVSMVGMLFFRKVVNMWTLNNSTINWYTLPCVRQNATSYSRGIAQTWVPSDDAPTMVISGTIWRRFHFKSKKKMRLPTN